MEISIDLSKLHVKNTLKMDKMEIPNLARNKNLVPNMIRLLKQNQDGTYSPTTNLQLKFWCGVELFEYKESYFMLYNFINLDDFKSIINKGDTCEFYLKCISEEPADYRIIIDYIESYGTIIYQERLSSLKTLFTDIKQVGYMTRLTLNFNKKVKDLKVLSTVSVTDLGEKEKWFYPFDIEDEEDNIYTIDLTKENSIYVDYSQFMRLVYTVVGEQDIENLLINVLALGYNK